MKEMKFMGRAAMVSLMAALLVSACSNSDGKSNDAQSTATPSSSPKESSTVKPQEKLTLNWFVPAPANANLPSADKDFVLKKIEEKFNVQLKLSYMVLGTDYNNKINALLASDPPDMWRDGNSDGGQRYVQEGLIAQMSDFSNPTTMPNYYKYWVSEETVKRNQFEGQDMRRPVPYSKATYRTYYIRKDWLDKLGLQMPTTYEQYVDVLKAFTFNDPDGNGKQDTYGFTTSGNGTNLGYDWPEMIKADLTFSLFIENNSIVDSITSPRMAGVLDDVAKLMNDKVIDPDWYLNTDQQRQQKAVQGKVGVLLGTTANFAFDNNQQGIQYRTKQLIPNADWEPFTMFPNKPLGTKPGPGSPFLVSKQVAEKSPEKVKRSMEILDWLASEEGFLLTHFGEAGKHYTREGNSIKLNTDLFAKEVVQQGDFLKIWSFFTPEEPFVYGLTLVNPAETDRDRKIAEYIRSIPANPALGTSLISPEGFDLAGFRKRMNELLSKAVFDDKSGKNWPQYREELMTKYKGTELFESYNESLRKAGIIR
ncbi:MAG: extracellular solute-binding protein [Paenibacillaceae bacterium]|nr:extracellular solute-binding protein [Paenibacillaceae bacterium]